MSGKTRDDPCQRLSAAGAIRAHPASAFVPVVHHPDPTGGCGGGRGSWPSAEPMHLLDVTEENWHAIMDVNALGTLIGIQEGARRISPCARERSSTRQPVRSLAAKARTDAAADVGRDRVRRRVPEVLLDDLGVGAGGQQEACCGVPQRVQGDVGEPGGAAVREIAVPARPGPRPPPAPARRPAMRNKTGSGCSTPPAARLPRPDPDHPPARPDRRPTAEESDRPADHPRSRQSHQEPFSGSPSRPRSTLDRG